MYKILRPNENRKVVRIIVFGDNMVGKTCILNRLIARKYSEETLTTIGTEKFWTKIKLNNGKEMKVILWDTSGNERYRTLAIKNIKYSDGCIIVFDVTSKKSFLSVSTWLDLIKVVYPNFLVILFGNKVDIDKYKWEVTNEEINKFIKEKNLKYFEVSAKNNIGINEGIEYIINEFCDKKEYIIIPPRKK